MKVTIAIVVHNRLHNIQHFFECWKKCDQGDTEIVVIHNYDSEVPEYRELCEKNGAIYIRRKNIGFDVGAFQDVCKGRLEGFPKWERLLWFIDDLLIMAPDFVKQFTQKMKKGVGVVAMEISPYAGKHIRTTGYMIDRETAERLEFPADPIVTKQHCYLFEHRGNDKTFYHQIRAMNLSVEWAADREVSPLWDSGYHRRLNRRTEHEAKFGEYKTNDKVLFICPIYKSYPAIISSLIMQTHQNWLLILIHDGPDTENVASHIPDDDRITFMETPKHGGCWGHYIRRIGLELFNDLANYIVVTNPDNQYAPPFLEYMLKPFERHPSAVATYLGQIIHSYTNWKVMNCRLEQGFLDCGGVMVKAEVAAAVPWDSISDHSADWFWFQDIIKKYGSGRFQKVDGVLFVHN